MKHLLASNALLSPLLLLIILLLFQLNPTTLTRAAEGEDVIFQSCSGASFNYTFNSQYESNLANLLQSLVSNGSRTGYLTTIIGEDPYTVYGLAQCRGDVSMEDCQTCLNVANLEIIKNCPDRRAATIRRESCLLRYATFNFFSTVDDYQEEIANHANVTDPVRFNKQLGALMKNLTSTAILEPSKFETGSTVYTDLNKIYGLVECTRDLSSSNCSACLQTMLKKIPACCSGKQGGQVIGRSCYVRFEVYKFFGLSLNPPPLPSPSPSPSPSPPSPPPSPLSPSPSPSPPSPAPSPLSPSPPSPPPFPLSPSLPSPPLSPSLPPLQADMSPQSNAGTRVNNGNTKSSSSASSPNTVIIGVTIILAALLKHCRHGNI